MTYTLSTAQLTIAVSLVIWEIVWKGWALWRAAHRNQPKWFVALLIINSVGLLPIAYLATHSSDTRVEIDDDEPSEPFMASNTSAKGGKNV